MAEKVRNESSNGQDVVPTDQGSSSHLTRKLSIITSILLFLAVIFLIVVEIGSTSVGNLTSIYFLRLNLSRIVPSSVPNAVLLNTIAQSIGLHDFYQVGLWNFCEGNVGGGITHCGKPHTLYWFDPVSILLNELLAGATIAIPAQVVTYLHILKVASQVMFGLFMTGIVLCFVVAILLPFCRRGAAIFGASVGTLLACLCTTLATIIATAIFTIITIAATSVTELNIGAEVGKLMLGLMWTASGLTIVAFLLQSTLCCCCRKRRRRENPKKSETV